MNIDTMVENHFKKNRDLFGFESITKLIEEMMDTMEALGIQTPLLTEAPAPGPGAPAPQGDTFTFDLIPTLPISEIGWGSLETPDKGAVQVPNEARKQLAQYLQNIGGGDIKGKLQELNNFFAGEKQPEATGSPAEQLKKTISYLIFYKTLTNIITNFNASAAGFAFESFLAVLLDAETGKQIPASAGSTIADIILFSGGRPISLKLYKEGSLKVGGSYRQLVDDLVGKYPVMEYIAVTKDLSGDGLDQQGTLNFYGFNFTLQNYLQILGLKKKELALMQIPEVFFRPTSELEEAVKKGGELEDLLKIPGRSDVNLKPVVDGFVEIVRQEMTNAEFEERTIKEFEKEFSNIVDRETGVYKGTEEKPKRFAYVTMGLNRGREGNMLKQMTLNKEELNALKLIMSTAFDKAVKKRKTLGGRGKARSEKLTALNFRSPRKSFKRLLQLQEEGSPELFALAAKNTIGYIKNIQFDLSKGDLGKLPSLANQDNLFPYGEFDVGSIEIGAANVQTMLDNSINIFNQTIFSIFTDLKSLSTNLNAYVAGGLEDDQLADAAEDDAESIASGTKEVKAKK